MSSPATSSLAASQIRYESAILRSIVMAFPVAVDLTPEPIPQEWILSGTPVARSKMLVRSRDFTESVVVWDCTAGSFRWHYSRDETLLFLSGEIFLQLENGDERRFGPGDVGFFPAGTSCAWRVADNVRKVAVIRETMWRPLGLCLKAWKKSLRLAGLVGKSPLMLALGVWTLHSLR
jgi:uncharacterized cupin superfamily protein